MCNNGVKLHALWRVGICIEVGKPEVCVAGAKSRNHRCHPCTEWVSFLLDHNGLPKDVLSPKVHSIYILAVVLTVGYG